MATQSQFLITTGEVADDAYVLDTSDLSLDLVETIIVDEYTTRTMRV